MEKRNISMWCRFYLPKVSRDFDVQIVISWSLWSGFLRATLFGNREFFIFVLAFFFLIVSIYPYSLRLLFLFGEGHSKNYRVTGNNVFTIVKLSFLSCFVVRMNYLKFGVPQGTTLRQLYQWATCCYWTLRDISVRWLLRFSTGFWLKNTHHPGGQVKCRSL